jgi:hypothetical protein
MAAIMRFFLRFIRSALADLFVAGRPARHGFSKPMSMKVRHRDRRFRFARLAAGYAAAEVHRRGIELLGPVCNPERLELE